MVELSERFGYNAEGRGFVVISGEWKSPSVNLVVNEHLFSNQERIRQRKERMGSTSNHWASNIHCPYGF